MNILTLEHIRKSYGERILFDGADFYLQEGEKVGIIGINGTGKSTFLRILCGEEEPDEGKRVMANGFLIRALPQQLQFSEDETALDYVLGHCRTAHSDWSAESDAKSMLNDLGVSDPYAKLSELSGGQKKRAALAAALMDPGDILVLDEPTNHLDPDICEWLEKWLVAFRKTLVLVTHDRYFLDSVCTRIVEIDKGSLYSYDTNYEGFLERKAEREAIDLATDRKRKSILRTELKWVQRGARARSTKQKARLERYEEMKAVRSPEEDKKIGIASVASRMGRTTLELEDVGMSYGENDLFSGFTYIFGKGDRVGFVGPNGCGKTTLMKILSGVLEPTSGTVRVGETIRIGYYSQEIETNPEAGISYMDPEKRVIDYIRDTAEYVRTPDGLVTASQMLDQFLFPPQEQYSRIGKLSGGEKRRLNLLRVLMEAPNILLMDEPTNDLDITTLAILEDYLDRFDGIVAVVSHDRYFLDRIVTRIFAFEQGHLSQYEGNYTDYEWKKKEAETELAALTEPKKETTDPSGSTPEATSGRSSRHSAQKLKFTWQEQRDFETIEEKIAETESRIADLEAEMEKCASDYSRLNELMKEKEEAAKKLDEQMERWMYLEDLYQRIQEQ